MRFSMFAAAVFVVAGLASHPAGQQQFTLASVQVVTEGGGRPLLKLAANGPLAHVVEPDPLASPSSDLLRVRLYGVTPAPGLAAQSGGPFVVQASAEGRDTVLTVQAPGLAQGTRLAVGTAARASELVIVVR